MSAKKENISQFWPSQHMLSREQIKTYLIFYWRNYNSVVSVLKSLYDILFAKGWKEFVIRFNQLNTSASIYTRIWHCKCFLFSNLSRTLKVIFSPKIADKREILNNHQKSPNSSPLFEQITVLIISVERVGRITRCYIGRLKKFLSARMNL